MNNTSCYLFEIERVYSVTARTHPSESGFKGQEENK